MSCLLRFATNICTSIADSSTGVYLAVWSSCDIFPHGDYGLSKWMLAGLMYLSCFYIVPLSLYNACYSIIRHSNSYKMTVLQSWGLFFSLRAAARTACSLSIVSVLRKCSAWALVAVGLTHIRQQQVLQQRCLLLTQEHELATHSSPQPGCLPACSLLLGSFLFVTVSLEVTTTVLWTSCIIF